MFSGLLKKSRLTRLLYKWVNCEQKFPYCITCKDESCGLRNKGRRALAGLILKQPCVLKISDFLEACGNSRAFDLLLKAKVISKVSSVGLLELPLNIQSSSRKFKTIMLDIGIWQKLSGVSIDHELLESDLMNIYRGALAEQFVGMKLATATDDDLLYWARESKSSNAEVDYVATVKGKVFSIEVKSGSSGSLKSLHLALQTSPNCPKGLVFSTREYAQIPEQKLMFLPLYYAGNVQNIIIS